MKLAKILAAAAMAASLDLTAGAANAQNHGAREVHKTVVHRTMVKKSVRHRQVCRMEFRNHRKVRVCR